MRIFSWNYEEIKFKEKIDDRMKGEKEKWKQIRSKKRKKKCQVKERKEKIPYNMVEIDSFNLFHI